MKKQRNFKFSEHVMDMLRELAKKNGMSNTATLEMLIIQEHTKEENMNTEIKQFISDFDMEAYTSQLTELEKLNTVDTILVLNGGTNYSPNGFSRGRVSIDTADYPQIAKEIAIAVILQDANENFSTLSRYPVDNVPAGTLVYLRELCWKAI